MEVYPISANQPSCKGYVHKSLKKFIHTVIQTECLNIAKTAKQQHEEVDYILMSVHKEQGERILEKLNQFINPLHKKTCIGINKSGFLKILNPIARRPITVYRSYYTKGAEWDSNMASVWIHSNNLEHVDTKKPNIAYLGIIERDVDELIKNVRKNSVETAILKLAENDLEVDALKSKRANILERLKIKLRAKSIDRYAKKNGICN